MPGSAWTCPRKPSIATGLAQREGLAEGTAVDTVPRLYGYTTARNVPWLVYVGIPPESALAPAWAHLYRNLKLGGSMLFVAVLVAFLIGQRIALPMQQLAADAAALGVGDLGHRSRVTTGGEAALLAQTLNGMAENLQQRSHALEQSEHRLRLITDHMPALISYVDRDERFRFTNAFYGDVYGVDPSKIIGQTMRELMGDRLYGEIKPKIDEALQGLPIMYELRQNVNGVTRDLAMIYFPDYGEKQEVLGFYVMGLDVTARTAAESSLRKSEQRLRSIADNLPVLIAVIDRDEIYRFCNETYRDWLGVDPATIVGCRLKDVSGLAEYAVIKPFVTRALAGESVTFEHTGLMGSSARHMLVTYLPLRNERNADKRSEVDGFYVLIEDLTERKTLEDQLSHMAQYDQLTGLPNRYLLHDRLQLACQRTSRESKQLAVLYLDVDDFKSINDALGHAAGDALLKQFGQRLKAQVRASDTVARVGGDEFVVLMEGFHSLDHLRSVAGKIIEAMQPAVRPGGPLDPRVGEHRGRDLAAVYDVGRGPARGRLGNVRSQGRRQRPLRDPGRRVRHGVGDRQRLTAGPRRSSPRVGLLRHRASPWNQQSGRQRREPADTTHRTGARASRIPAFPGTAGRPG